MTTITKTQMISIYDRMVKSNHELVTVAYYLADCSQSEINRFMAQNHATAQKLLAL